MPLFQASATIQNIRTLADKTLRLQVDFQELSPEEMQQVFSLYQKLGWFLFKENSITMAEVPDGPAPEFKEDESPSKKLRNLLWVYWDKVLNKKGSFEIFYQSWYRKKGEEIKELLPK